MKTNKKETPKQEQKLGPTPEQLKNWMERDLQAAIAFLHIILSNTKIMAMIQDELLQANNERKGQL